MMHQLTIVFLGSVGSESNGMNDVLEVSPSLLTALFPDHCPFYHVGEQLVSGTYVEQTCKVLQWKSQ